MAILQALENTDDRRDQTLSPRYVIYEDDIDEGARGESARYVRHEDDPRYVVQETTREESPRYVVYDDEDPRFAVREFVYDDDVRRERDLSPHPGRVEEVIVYSKPEERPRSSGVYSS